MAHFALLDQDKNVMKVIVVNNDSSHVIADDGVINVHSYAVSILPGSDESSKPRNTYLYVEPS